MSRTKTVSALEGDIEKQAEDLMKDFAAYTTGVRYLALLHRSKDGGDQNSEYKRRGGYAITHSPEEYHEALVRLLSLKAVSSKPYRLYASLNPRNMAKGEKAFKMDMLMCDFDGAENKEYFWKRLESKWVSALMQPGSRSSSLFMIDADGEGDVTAPVLIELSKRGVEPVKQYRTPNGWHIITEPFNPTDWSVPNAEVKKDGLILLVP